MKNEQASIYEDMKKWFEEDYGGIGLNQITSVKKMDKWYTALAKKESYF